MITKLSIDLFIMLCESCNDLNLAIELVYKPNGINIECIEQEKESQEYGAAKFNVSNKKVIFRIAKLTPKKVGFFVAIWKREEGVTKPYSINDNFDYFIISVRDNNHFGHFIFNKQILQSNNIIYSNKSEGKRGIRVYPPWVKVPNKQSEKSQKWQCNHFIRFDLNSVCKNTLAFEGIFKHL